MQSSDLAWALLYGGMPFHSHTPSCISVLLCETLSRLAKGARSASLVAVVAAMGSSILQAAATVESFGVGKKSDYLQSSAATPSAHAILGDPNGPFHFSADLLGGNLSQLSPAPKVALPSGTLFALTGDNLAVGLATNYSSKSALDTAFPNGSYTIMAGANSLPISLGTIDAYPTTVPQVTNGTWDGQGKLVINAATGTTLNFNNFAAYATGAGGWIFLNLYAVSGTVLGSELASAKSLALGAYGSDPALETYTIPSGLLQPDRTYYAEISYARVVHLNVDYFGSLGAVGTAAFMNTTGFMISTSVQASAPTFTTQPSSLAVALGANVTFTVAASGNPAPAFQWRKDGMNISGATFPSFSLTNVQFGDAGSYTVTASNGAGIATSDAAILTVNPVTVAPTITTQPTSQTVAVGSSVSFTATANGTPAPTLQWQKDNISINGATNATLTLNSVTPSDAGSYALLATNSANTATSNPATLTVTSTGTLPIMTAQPLSQTVIAGNTVTFAASAIGTPAPTFQWQKNGVNIQGATSPSYIISSAIGGDEGAYTVVVTNSVGVVTSDVASLTVIVPPGDVVVSFAIE